MSQTTQERDKALVVQREEAAFPRLTSAELALVRPLASFFGPVNRTSICTLSNAARWRFATQPTAD